MVDRKEVMEKLAAEMKTRFGEAGEIKFFRGPGRVDLMGSHTDYNQGFILALTVDREIVAAARPRKDNNLWLYSLNTQEEVKTGASGLRREEAHGWANYPKGVIKEILDRGAPFSGMEMIVHGNIPVGGNLSSSAALEAVTCEAALAMSGKTMPLWEKIKLCQRAENEFMGMPCGIMDQFAVFTGDEGVALELDCRSLQYDSIPFKLDRALFLVIDSGLGRKLVASKYSERVKECKAAVEILARKKTDSQSLRAFDMAEIESSREELGDVLYRRARHVANENTRVKKAGEAIRKGDLKALGRIMEEGYLSSRDYYENSIPQLDQLHDIAAAEAGMMGVRICGAGWGGCLLALVEKDRAESAGHSIIEKHKSKTGLDGRFYAVKPSPGAGPVK